MTWGERLTLLVVLTVFWFFCPPLVFAFASIYAALVYVELERV